MEDLIFKDVVPTFAQYMQAKNICLAYQNNQEVLYQIRLTSFKKELSEYFLNNPHYKIIEFDLNGNTIIPTKPRLEDYYGGEMDDDIEVICKKHNVKFSIIYWCYHK